MTSHQFATASPKLPSPAPFALCRPRVPTLHNYVSRPFALPAQAAHDFGRIRVHPPGVARLADDTPCASGRFGMNGGTGCDASTGKSVTTIYNPPPCYRHCVERHEAVHARDIAPCCARSNAAYKAAKSDDERDAVQDKINRWVSSNEDFLECRAYTESAKCGREYADQNCGAKKQEAGSSADQPIRAGEPPVSVQPVEAGQPGQPAAGGELAASPQGMLAEAGQTSGAGSKTPGDTGAGATAPGPEQCCAVLKCYWRVSQGRADNVCGRAPRALTRCPF
jgi:hypothetical protein